MSVKWCLCGSADPAHVRTSACEKQKVRVPAVPPCDGNDTGYHRWNIHGVCSDCEATRFGKTAASKEVVRKAYSNPKGGPEFDAP